MISPPPDAAGCCVGLPPPPGVLPCPFIRPPWLPDCAMMRAISTRARASISAMRSWVRLLK